MWAGLHAGRKFCLLVLVWFFLLFSFIPHRVHSLIIFLFLAVPFLLLSCSCKSYSLKRRLFGAFAHFLIFIYLFRHSHLNLAPAITLPELLTRPCPYERRKRSTKKHHFDRIARQQSPLQTPSNTIHHGGRPRKPAQRRPALLLLASASAASRGRPSAR